MSPVRKPEPIVVRVERREIDDPTRRRELVLLLAKLVEQGRHSGRKSR